MRAPSAWPRAAAHRHRACPRVRPDHQEPAPPLLPDQILRERVGQHRARRRGMNDVGAAVLLAQSIVDRADIEENKSRDRPASAALSSASAGRSASTSDTPRSPARARRQRHRPCRRAALLQREALVEEPAGRVVVVDRELRAGDPVVVGRDVGQRETGLRLRAAQISDLDLDRIGRGCGPREKEVPASRTRIKGTLRSEVVAR